MACALIVSAVVASESATVGSHARRGRRPASESATKRDRNIALFYSTFRTYSALMPKYVADWRKMMTSVGLDPDDDQQSTQTPIGIGNMANAAVAAAERDGMNMLGDEGGHKILQTSANLTDGQKVKAEFFNNKFLALGASVGVPKSGSVADLDDWIEFHVTVDIADWDTIIAAWYNKYIYDAVRPITAIRYLYGNKPLTAWGGPGKGTVHDISGNDWQSYLPTPNHPEYPSGSTSVCSAQAAAARLYHGTDALDFSYTAAKGSSQIEPGLVPAQDTKLAWSNFAKDCGMSRLLAGVHFMSSIKAGWGLGPKIAPLAYAFVQRHIKGQTG